jgi:DNA repair protein RecN (Recombination protein N)
MLRSLDIRDMVLIDRLELTFQPGLNVLTGETGAGKSILLDCLGFVLGWKGRADLVRQGAAQGEVSAVFDLPPGHPARAALADAGITAEDDLILRRVTTADGRKTAFVNDRRAGAEVLRALSDRLVELHGQHDDHGLLNPRAHRRLLDDFAGAAAVLADTRSAWADLSASRRALSEAEARLAALRAEEDFLRHAVAELVRLSPEPGEEAALDTRRRLMQGAARIRDDIARAAQALGSDGAEGAMIDARRWLDGAADKAEGALDDPLTALDRALAELGEAAQGVERALDALTFDPSDLEATEERLFAIRALARKHAVTPDDLAAHAATLSDRLGAIDGGAGQIKGLQQAVTTAEADYTRAATALTALRSAAAKRLDKAMKSELPPLKLDRAVFRTDIGAGDPGPEGRDAVSFAAATNPGAPEGPIDRIASGGELSRFLLALKVCLTAGQDGLTLIFDEIDRGVGGATADAVGRRLASLSDTAQILVVTHSPQVAARGAHHWRVEKRVRGQMTTSTVVPLDAPARVDEVARMLAGDQVTDAAREAARVLLAG